ncbi:hypothetical protein NBRC116590_22890 [Pelagimonas sp. KU-00592-HH]|uniref:porin n=1 Tax=Pelagimonas sp. KU-00592-HH TaxID=3127651 RepID=UPI0031049D82
MKKVLFATTALVATAGVAAADVTFGGFGRFGIDYQESRGTEETRLESRFRLIITGTAESDNGLSFGAQVRFQSNEAADTPRSGAGMNTPRFWVSTGGLTVSVGNILGAIDSLPGVYTGGVGLTGLGFNEFAADSAANGVSADQYSSGGSARFGVDVIYTMGGLNLHLSHTPGDAYLAGVNGGTERTALGAAYSFGNYTVAAAVQDSDNAADTEWVVSASGTVGALTAALTYADNGTAGDKVVLGLDYAVSDSTNIAGFIADDESAVDSTAAGIGVRHSLGGGVSLRAGIVDDHGDTRADMGVIFNF